MVRRKNRAISGRRKRYVYCVDRLVGGDGIGLPECRPLASVVGMACTDYCRQRTAWIACLVVFYPIGNGNDNVNPH